MDERVMQFRVGVFFLGALIAAAILLALFGKLPKYIGSYPVQVAFANAGGITKDTPVRKSGILIGRVGDIALTDEDERVLVTLNIQTGKTVYQNEIPFITRDLLGDTAVVFMPSKDRLARHVPIEAGAVIKGEYSEDPTGLKRTLQGPIDTVQNTGVALSKASEQLGAAAKRVEDILNEDAQRDTRDILRDAAKSLKVVQKILGDEKSQNKLAEAVSKLPDTLDGMNRTFARSDEMLRQFTERSGPDKKTPIERMVETIEMTQRTLRKFSEPSESGKEAPADQIAAAMQNIGEITDLMRSIMSRINKGEGSLGALLNDRQLYDRLNKAAKNIEQVSRELRPIVEDAGVLMDKAARHPGVIIRDAVKPGVGIK
jgi:phospholipid/cholesterol/gamma-HCH transport system substrate-binding protein